MIKVVLTPEQKRAQVADYRINYFAHPHLDLRKVDELQVITPLGQRVQHNDVYVVDNQSAVRRYSADFLFFEVTPNCNMTCGFCSNKTTRKGELKRENVRYVDMLFAQEFAESIGDNPYVGRTRTICLTGGEPTLELEKLAEITGYFGRLGGKNQIVVPTNCSTLPLDQSELEDTMSKFDSQGVEWRLSFNFGLIRQFASISGYQNRYYQIPDSEEPLLDKILLIKEAAEKVGAKTGINICGYRNELDWLNEEIRRRLGEETKNCFFQSSRIKRIGNAVNHEDADDVSVRVHPQKESMYVRNSGTIFPSGQVLFNRRLQLGTLCREDAA
jgi:organic radical activating enzyme